MGAAHFRVALLLPGRPEEGSASISKRLFTNTWFPCDIGYLQMGRFLAPACNLGQKSMQWSGGRNLAQRNIALPAAPVLRPALKAGAQHSANEGRIAN